MMITTTVTLKRFLNTTDRTLEWIDPFGRRITLAPHRGGHFAPCDELGRLISKGDIAMPADPRFVRTLLPNSTERQGPFG